jgi:hypothetical protein
MKTPLLCCLLLQLSISFSQTKNWCVENPLSNLGFTENVGRWSNVMNEDVQYYAYFGSYYIYFSNDAFVFGKEVELSPEEAHERHEKLEHKEQVEPIPWTYFKIELIGSNQNSTVLATNLKRHTVNFQDQTNPELTIKSKVYDTLIFKDIYANIDLEFYFHKEGGLKYNFLVHPGGDYTDIIMNYEGALPEKTETGGLSWENSGDPFTDHAPTSAVGEKSVKTQFIVNKNQVKFKVEKYDLTQKLIIDPWITMTLLGSRAWDVAMDELGNCVATVDQQYVYFDNSGTLLWTLDPSIMFRERDVAINPITRDIYTIIEYDPTKVFKIDPSGAIVGHYVTIDIVFSEIWRLKYSPFHDKIIVGEGGHTGAVDHLSLLDLDITTYDPYEVFPIDPTLAEDCTLLDVDPHDGSFYALFSGNQLHDYPSNLLFKLNALDPTNIIWVTHTNHYFTELSNAVYGNSINGVNGIACGLNYVYTYDGHKILQINKSMGTHVDSVFLDSEQFTQYGIDTDACGKVYVGTHNSIQIFTEDLVPFGEFALPDTCYDLVIEGNFLTACGKGFVAQFELGLAEGNFEITTTESDCNDCNGTITILPLIGLGPFSYNLDGVINLTGTFTELCQGKHHLLITDSSGCTFNFTITIGGLHPALNLQLVSVNQPSCYGFTDGSITVTAIGDDVNYTWLPTNPIEGNTFDHIGAGTYTVYAESGEEECFDTLLIELIQPDSLFADLSVTNPICYGDQPGFAVVDSVYNAQGDLSNISFVWSPDPPGISGVGADSLYNMPAGNYILTMTDDRGCSWVKEFSITTPEPITFSEFGFDPAFCRLYGYQNGNGVLFAAAIGGTPDYDYLWENLDNGESTVNSTWGGLNPGNYRITVTDANGCILTQNLFLDSLNPIAAFSVISAQLDASLEGTELVIANFINESSNFSNPNDPFADTTFFWNLNHPQADWFISNDFFELIDTSYVGEAIYEVCLVAINKNGCYDTTCKDIIVHIQPKFVAPNVFSPDGDGINDDFTFEFKSLGIETFSCVILNRWGIKVAEFINVTDAWNGTDLQGDECTDGVYFYTYKAISTNQTIFEGQGNVQILRK